MDRKTPSSLIPVGSFSFPYSLSPPSTHPPPPYLIVSSQLTHFSLHPFSFSFNLAIFSFQIASSQSTHPSFPLQSTHFPHLLFIPLNSPLFSSPIDSPHSTLPPLSNQLMPLKPLAPPSQSAHPVQLSNLPFHNRLIPVNSPPNIT